MCCLAAEQTGGRTVFFLITDIIEHAGWRVQKRRVFLIHTHTHTRTHTYIHTYTYTDTETHTHTQRQARGTRYCLRVRVPCPRWLVIKCRI